MADIIKATTRTEFGKGAARRTRRDGKVPAVLYGHGTDPVHIALPGHEVLLALRVANALLEIEIDGKDTQLALPKQIQRNPIRGSIEHLDLIIVRRGEKVHVDVPLELKDKERSGAVVLLDMQALAIEVEATNIPNHIVVDVTALEVGDSLTAGELELPEGAVLTIDPDTTIVTVSTVAAEPEPVAEGEEAAEGEGGEAAAAEAPAAAAEEPAAE
ncbi:MAG: 50S ribosomal protein L25/general stress protein Ctc [Propionibacteriaceae bacterium]|jgi:large subunit ribosomal protein L25|nr:50S ribosomal protein L25/general stress protein Ctc [Propionibacteriaceae bacterium]